MFKLDPKSLKCIFLGYSRVQKGYRCYCPSLRRYVVSVDVTFLENDPFSPDPIHTSHVTPQNPGVPMTTVNLRKPVCLIS